MEQGNITSPLPLPLNNEERTLEIGRKCFLDNIDMNEDEETYSHSNAVNKANSECTLAMDISPDNVVGAIGEQQFWKVRRTIIK